MLTINMQIITLEYSLQERILMYINKGHFQNFIANTGVVDRTMILI